MSTRIVVIGASHGGVQALCALVAKLPANLPAPVFVVQHTAREGRSRLPELLSAAGPLPACHPRPGEFIRPGQIYVAPPDHHMLIRPRYVWLSRGPRENHTRPAVDPLFRSAALAYGTAVVGVVLTGYLDDGTAGAMAVKARGGTVIVQDPSEASAPSMPTSALNHVPDVDHCCKVEEIAALLVHLANDDPPTGTLCELPEKNLLRFRCHSGHAYSAQSLASAKAVQANTARSALHAARSSGTHIPRPLGE